METVEVDLKKMANQATISVVLKNFKQWQIRMRVGMRVIKLAAWIMGTNIEFKEAVPFGRMTGPGSITEEPCQCLCGWSGTVWGCEADVDGDGSLGCPECGRVIEWTKDAASVSLDDVDGLVENLIEYTDQYFGSSDENGIARLVGEAEDVLIAQGETNWDDVYLRKICKEKYYDWKKDRLA